MEQRGGGENTEEGEGGGGGGNGEVEVGKERQGMSKRQINP